MERASLSRIAVITGRDPSIKDDTDGGSVFMEYLLRDLSKLSVSVDVFTPLGVSGGLYDARKLELQLQHSASERLTNIHFQYVPIEEKDTLQILSEQDYFLARISRSKRFAEYFADGKLLGYDATYILHVANAFSLVQNGYVALDRTILFPMMTSSNYEEFSQVPNEYVKKERETFQVVKNICCPSDDEIERIRGRFDILPDRLFKVNRGFDEEDFPAHKRTGENLNQTPITLLCANGIRPQKDHLFMIPVVEELLGAGHDVLVHLTGNNGRSHNPLYNAYADEFWKTVADHGLTEKFIAHDILPRNELVSLMEGSTIAIYPSISETFGKSALESVVSGLPTIVCDDVPAFGEFIKNESTGIVSPRIPKEFAARISRLVSDPELYMQISAAGIELRSSFSWKHIMRKFREVQAKRGILPELVSDI